jgi:putative NADPH-quinone reductase
MTKRRILIIDGHPDSGEHFVHTLANAYAWGAARHEVRTLRIGALDFPLIRSQEEWMEAAPPPAIAQAQDDIRWAEHLLILYPLWLGDMPALLKALLEQTIRPDFAIRYGSGRMPEKLLMGRSARIVVPMGMPAFFYKLFYGAHSVKSLERNILKFVGINPVERTIIGNIEAGDEARQA